VVFTPVPGTNPEDVEVRATERAAEQERRTKEVMVRNAVLRETHRPSLIERALRRLRGR
jgi:hypothetical protein